MNKAKGIIVTVVWLLWIALSYYVLLPAINIHSVGFWLYLIFAIILPLAVALGIMESTIQVSKRGVRFDSPKYMSKVPKICFGIVGTLIVLGVILMIFSAEFFHAKKYASILKIEEYEFTEDIDQTSALSKIALMDTNSAIRLGNREIGSLTELVSQYNVSEQYSQIDVNGSPIKVAALDYDGFFKWAGNRKEGVPGYVTVDPVGQSANYVSLDAGMKYVPSAVFNERLERHIRFQYPTAIFDNTHFEIDEEGNPYYVSSVYEYTIGVFGGQTVKGAIITDPTTGDSQYYSVAEIPNWVDNVFNGELLTTQYNWYGELSNGFWNSVIGKKGCKKCTQTADSDGDGYVADYGYISKDGDIWIYTGITSVNDDASNIGFILINQRTGDAHYYIIPGADENSAMSAAEGEVQEKRYIASFPSLINVDGQPTYVMVLKDSSGIVKLYAMVNVEQYNIVTTAASLDDCFSKYRKLMGEEDVIDEPVDEPDDNAGDKLGEVEEVNLTIASIQYVAIGGDTYVYLESADGVILRQKFADNELLITLREGDVITAKARKSSNGTYYMDSFSK